MLYAIILATILDPQTKLNGSDLKVRIGIKQFVFEMIFY